jgi:uncharacterized protein with HEPN domain
MLSDRDQATVYDIYHAAQLVVEFQGGLSQSAFAEDLKTQSAILHQLLVVGEAVKRLSADLRASSWHPLGVDDGDA